MARRKKGGAKKAESDAPTEEATAPETAPEIAEETSEEGHGGEAGSALDPAASDRLLKACAGIASASSIAMSELQRHAGPFLTFAQKTNISALATNFEAGFGTVDLTGSATPRQVVEGGLSRGQIEEIVASSVTAAVKQALLQIGASADDPLRDQVERQVDSQMATQEHRLLEYVKKHLLDSLEILEESLDDRIVMYLEGHEEKREAELEHERTQAEVDKQVEEAKDNLLQSIDEVRSIELGFDVSEFAAGLSQVVGEDNSGDQAIGEIELGGDELEIEVGDDELEIEVGGDEDDLEIEADDDELEIEAVDDELEIEVADDDLEIEVAAEGPEIELGDADAGVDTVERPSGPVDETSTLSIELMTLDLDVSGTEDAVEVELGSGEDEDVDVELGDHADLEGTVISPVLEDDDSDSEVSEEIVIEADADVIEEISVEDVAIEVDGGLDVDEDDLIELDLSDFDEDDDNPALQTLGSGPDDIDSLSVAEVSADYEIEAIEDEPLEGDDEDVTRNIEHYLKRAAEMRARKQSAAAMELYSKVIDLDGDNYEARVGRGVVHLEAKDYKRSVEEFTRADRIDPSKPSGSLGIAEVHFHRKQFSKAIKHYTRCLKIDDKLAQAYCNRGLSYYYQKNYKKAFLDLMKAYELDSELPNIKKYLKLVKNKVKSDKK